ncbi:hypothetical protein [Prescottella agglutinans]|uniref:Uncharacterized protein n=1 Tax=Prescottella agglutinans TaxID=1644129 RepID=A0ABT6MLE3_9NOCA|nr:hypothetical protein [Prescottella agglutinans]MDH6284631.1 hypothetical protein [Prescottella agglutinans]
MNAATAIATATPEDRTIARAAERLAEVQAGDVTADTAIVIAALTPIAAATADTVDAALDQVLAVVQAGEARGAHGHAPVREIVWLRNRLVGARAGWLGTRPSLTIPVIDLDEKLQVVGERVVSLPC